jgi:RsiW-degrading membrane proteinase PrsW (M82 family)
MESTHKKGIPALWWLLALAAAIYANYYPELFQLENALLFIATLISGFIVYKVTRWADAYEHETRESLIWTITYGCGISILITVTLYELIPDQFESNLVVSVVEESSKALVLLPLIYLRCINSWTDGLVFGSMAGLGFSISEDFWYALDSESPLETIVFRQVYSIFGHSLFSAFLFAAICSLYLHSRKKIFLLMASLAIGSHWLWNTGIYLIDFNDFYVYAIVPPAAFVLLAYILRTQEKKELLFLGEKLVNSEIISQEELEIAYDLTLRKRVRRLLANSAEKQSFDEKVSSDVQLILASAKSPAAL